MLKARNTHIHIPFAMSAMDVEDETFGDESDALLPEFIMLLIFEYAGDEQDDALLPASVMNIIFEYAGDAPAEEEEMQDDVTVKDYSKAVIYQIKPIDTTKKDMYVGSTADYWVREACHRRSSVNPKTVKRPLYANTFIHANGGWNAWSMTILENYPCSNRKELEIRETYWIRELHPNLNINLPRRTYGQYYNDTSEYQRARHKSYKLTHKETIKAINDRYAASHKEQLAAKNKQWQEDNQERVVTYRHEWQKTNRVAQLEKARIKYANAPLVTCACGFQTKERKMTSHRKSERCKKLIAAKALEAQQSTSSLAGGTTPASS